MTRKKRALDGLEQDIRDHIERETQEHVDRGLPPDEARRQALVRFGNPALAREDTRAVWIGPWIDQTRQDVRYALRTFRRNPGFATVVVLTLALGIGASTAIFSLFEAVMLRTLPIQASWDVFFVAHGSGRRAVPGSNYPYFERVRARTDVFAGVTTYQRGAFKVTAGDTVENVGGQFVSGNYHGVLGVPMVLGRGFTSEEDRDGAGAPIAVISGGYRTRRFGADADVLGRTLVVDGREVSIVGVTAPGFTGLDPGTRPDITLPLSARALGQPDFFTSHETWFGDMPIVARLRPGVTREQASSVADAVFQQFLAEPQNAWLFKFPPQPQVRASLLPAGRGTAGLRDQYSLSLRVLLGMVAVVLLIGCANVANLLLARGMSRAREVALRMSIGAGRVRLVRQFLTESLLLALIGGALGFALSRTSVAAIATLVGSGANPVHLDVQPNTAVMLFAIGASVLTGLLFGLAPAWWCTGPDTAAALKGTGAPVRLPGRRWSARQALVAAQIALCVLLVAAAGLLGSTLRNLESRGAGFDRANVLMFSLDVRGTSVPAYRLPGLCDDLIARLGRRPDVVSAACSRNIPVHSRGNAAPLEVPGGPPLPLHARYVFTNMITPEYFRTLGVGVVAGRVFDARDSARGEPVAVVNRALVRLFFGNADPIGRRVHFFKDDEHPMTIVGVVEDTLQRSLRDEPPMTVYTPLPQLRGPEPVLTVSLRTRQDPLTLAPAARSEVRAVSAAVVVDAVRTMEQQIGSALVRERLLAIVSTAFGLLALALSCIGLYGVVSYDVARSVRELGIRVALGAGRVEVVRHVVHAALSVSSIGIAVGIAVAIGATRLLATLLFGVEARDPLTLAGAAALLLLTTLMASLIPASRAARVDPVIVLRAE